MENTSENDGFGQNVYGGDKGSGKRYPRGLKKGLSERRILPAMHSLARSGRWNVYKAFHDGYRVPAKNDPSKTFSVDIICTEDKDNRTGLIRRACKLCDRFNAQDQARAQLFDELKRKGASDADVFNNEAYRLLHEWVKGDRKAGLWGHVPNRWILMNTETLESDFECTKIRYRLFKELLARISKVQQKNRIVDPLSLETGVWWEFNHTGTTDPDTVVPATVVVTVGGEEVEKLKVTALAGDQKKKALEVCPDLATEVGVYLDEQQMEDIANCSEDPEEIEAIIARTQKRSVSSTSRASTPSTQPKTETAAAPKTETKAEVKAEPKTETAPAASSAPAASALAEVPDDVFLSQFNIGKK